MKNVLHSGVPQELSKKKVISKLAFKGRDVVLVILIY
jgi:hypothetical protein